MRWDLILERRSINRLNESKLREKLKYIANAAGRNQTLGFSGKVGRIREPEKILDENANKELYRYVVKIRLTKEKSTRSAEAAQKQFEHVLGVVKKAASSEDWQVLNLSKPLIGQHQDIEKADPQQEIEVIQRPSFVLPPLTDDVYKKFFGDIYERNPHIRTMYKAIKTSIETEGKILSHILLYGLPGSCKTKIAEKLKIWFEFGENEGVERVMFVDGTTMSKAGLENWLLDLAEDKMLPEVLVVDELEKQPIENISCLNNVMGSGVLAKLNARIGNRREKVKFTVIGICNDEQKLKGSQSGAIWSRFTHKLRCVRPSRELCLKILEEECDKIPKGNRNWAKKALDFGWDTLKERDIRAIRGHLNGRDDLLNGMWQRDQIAIRDAEAQENGEIGKEE